MNGINLGFLRKTRESGERAPLLTGVRRIAELKDTQLTIANVSCVKSADIIPVVARAMIYPPYFDRLKSLRYVFFP